MFRVTTNTCVSFPLFCLLVNLMGSEGFVAGLELKFMRGP